MIKFLKIIATILIFLSIITQIVCLPIMIDKSENKLLDVLFPAVCLMAMCLTGLQLMWKGTAIVTVSDINGGSVRDVQKRSKI